YPLTIIRKKLFNEVNMFKRVSRFFTILLTVSFSLATLLLFTAGKGESEKPKAEPATEKIVRFDEVWPPRLDPALGQDFSSSILYCNIYDSLVFPEPDGSVVPHANILTIAPHYGEGGSPLTRYHTDSTGTWEHTEWLQDPEVDEMITDALERHAYQSAYLEWDTVERIKTGGKSIPVQGYKLYMRGIKVYPDRIPYTKIWSIKTE
ncbi:MAG: hypothetical protein KAJ15_10735, partial [Spirochaetes bacterium]|nr:hypothetical protein [Spirochaetota bacterium]